MSENEHDQKTDSPASDAPSQVSEISEIEMLDAGGVLYGLDDKPPAPRALVLACQHVLMMFGSTVAVPLLLGPSMGMDDNQIAILISSVMLCSGIATFIQASFGSRLPIIQGVSFSFLAAFAFIIATVQERGGTPAESMQYIAGSILIGGVIEMTIGFSGLFGKIREVLSPVVVGPVIMLIGLALYQFGAPMAGLSWPISILTMACVVVFSYVLARKQKIFRMFPILLAILISVGVCALLTFSGLIDQTHAAFLKTEHVATATWFRTDPAEVFLPWGVPKFHLGFTLAVLAGFLASMIESFGDYHACNRMAGGDELTSQQISRGIGCEGVGCAITGLLGGFSSTSYSENIGLVGITKVGSRYVVQIAGVLLIVVGLIGKFGAVAAAMPKPIVGGLYCVMFGLISAVGIKELTKADLNLDRNLFVAGFSLFMGLSVPFYFASDAGVELLEQIGAYSTALKDVVGAIGNTSMAVAAIIGLALDNTLPATRKQRGLSS